MDNSFKKHNYQSKKLWQWIFTLAVILSLFGSSFLLYKWWQTKQNTSQIQAKEQTLSQLEQQQKALQIYQTQQKQLSQVLILAKNPTIHQFFNDLIQGFACRFAEKQNLSDYCLPLTFGSFYQKPIQDGEKQGEMGNCLYQSESRSVVISLNQVFLFNKLFANPECYLDISFASLMETISHELAHYFQFSKYGLSSCESSGKRDNKGNFLFPKLVNEHTQFAKEIKEMIANSAEYPILKKYWKVIDVRS